MSDEWSTTASRSWPATHHSSLITHHSSLITHHSSLRRPRPRRAALVEEAEHLVPAGGRVMAQRQVEDPAVAPWLGPGDGQRLSLVQRGGQHVDARIVVEDVLLVLHHELDQAFGDRVRRVGDAYLVVAVARVRHEEAAHHGAVLRAVPE